MLVSLEMGKIRAQGVGEVQETSTSNDPSVLSRMFSGKGHSKREAWSRPGELEPSRRHGIITAFNFPVAVSAGTSAAMACGDTQCSGKEPPTTTPTSVAITKVVADVLARTASRAIRAQAARRHCYWREHGQGSQDEAGLLHWQHGCESRSQ